MSRERPPPPGGKERVQLPPGLFREGLELILTPKQVQYIDISNTKLRNDLTIEGTAESFGISVTRVNNALRWAKENRVNNLAAAEDLQLTIASLMKRLKWLESQRRLVQRESRRRNKDTNRMRRGSLPVVFISTYLREARKIELAIAELKGIYKRTLDVHHTGSVEAEVHVYLPDNSREGRIGPN